MSLKALVVRRDGDSIRRAVEELDDDTLPEGEVTVDYGDRGRKVFSQGQSFLEEMKVTHAGMNLGSVPVRILAVYMGAAGSEDVIPMK